MKPLWASIIIACYNKAPYIRKAVDSALLQTFKDVQVVVVDDGSTDGSGEILREYGDKITLGLTGCNNGVSAARNIAAAYTQSKFILSLDADDWIEPNFLMDTIPYMADPEVAIVATAMQYEGLGKGIILPGGSLEMEKYQNEIPCCSLIRRAAFEEVGGYNPASEPYEDWNLWISILERGWRCANHMEPLFHYRVLPVSASSNTRGRHQELFNKIKSLHQSLYGGH